MKRVLSILLILTMCLGFTACGEKIDPNDPAKDGVTNLADFIPDLYGKKLEVYAGETSVTFGEYENQLLSHVYISGTEEENVALLDYLLSIDLEGAEEIEFIGGSSNVPWLRFGFRDEADWYTVCFYDINRPETGEFQSIIVYRYDIRNGKDPETIAESSMQENTDRKQYKFPVGTFDMAGIDAARKVIWQNTGDPEYSGTATYIETGETYPLWRQNAALARNILEGTLTYIGTVEAMKIDADFEVVIEDATYLIDTETGNFSKKAGRETVYGNLDGLELKLRYDVLSSIKNGAE